jgi:hypothetical protein
MGFACEGRDGAIRFSGRLGEELGQAETLEAETLEAETLEAETLYITLDGVPDP